eukprot:c40902_g1_i1 orf=190-606(-)
MEEHEFCPGYCYTLELVHEPGFPESPRTNIVGHFVFRDKGANIFIFKKAEKSGPDAAQEEAGKSGRLTFVLINGDCIAKSQLEKDEEIQQIDLLKCKNDFGKEWVRFRSRKVEVDGEQPRVEQEQNGQSSSEKEPNIS